MFFQGDLAQKVVEAVEPVRDQLDVAHVFPSLPEVVRLNKQSGSEQEREQRLHEEEGRAGCILPSCHAQDCADSAKALEGHAKQQGTRNFVLSFQYWLGGSSDNLQNFLSF